MIVCLSIATIFVCDTFLAFLFLLQAHISQKRKKASENDLASPVVLGQIPFVSQE